MKISYAICVCNEHTELNALLSFLTDVIDNEDEINILVDSGKVTDEVRLALPRINIIPGYTEEWCKKMKFSVNEMGWINWPDYQGRFFKNNGKITWSLGLHERLVGSDKVAQLQANPQLAIWHIKSVQKQDKQDTFYKNLKEH